MVSLVLFFVSLPIGYALRRNPVAELIAACLIALFLTIVLTVVLKTAVKMRSILLLVASLRFVSRHI